MYGVEFHVEVQHRFAFFTGIMESNGYQTILERNLLPFIQKTYPDGHRFWQDNDPKHTSNSTKNWFAENGINHWKTPPESPVCYLIYVPLYNLTKQC